MVGDSRGDDDSEEGVVRPEDLDFTADDRVAELRSGRYVIATGDSRRPNLEADDSRTDDSGRDPEATDLTSGEAGGETGRVDLESARERMAEHVSAFDAPHGFAFTTVVDGTVHHHEAFSEDLPAVFGELLTWYATVVGDAETPPAEVLGILLAASNRPVRLPVGALKDALDSLNLGPEDRIADLLQAAADDGVAFPADDGQ